MADLDDDDDAELGAVVDDIARSMFKTAKNKYTMAVKYDEAVARGMNKKLAIAIALGLIIGRQLR